MEIVGIASALVALALSFTAREGSKAQDRALENLLGVSQLRACCILGVPPLPMREGPVPTLATNGRVIMYNARFLIDALGSICQRRACVEGLVLAMVAHEVAHAYCHPDAQPGHRIELEADQVAGYVLGRTGTKPEDFLAVLATFRATRLHPPVEQRAAAVRKGYARGVAESATASATSS